MAYTKEEHAAYQREWRKRNPEKWAAAKMRNRKKHPHKNREYWARKVERDGAAGMMWERAKKRAKALGRDFSIEVSDIEVPEFCPVLGIRLEPLGKDKNNSPSLDRIHSNMGYVKGNIIVISHRANTLKRDATVEELRKLAAFYDKLEF